MKRLACLLASLVLAFALVSCAKSPVEETPEAPSEPGVTAPAETEPEEEEAAPVAEPEPEVEPEEEPAPAPTPAQDQATPSFVSIYSDENFAEVRAFMEEEGLPAAVAYAGSLRGRTVDALLMTSYLAETYPFVRSIPSSNFAIGAGEEVFVIVPRDSSASVSVTSFAESPVVGELLYRNEVGDPIVVVCDGFCLDDDATLKVTVVDETGIYEFVPYVTTGNIPCLGDSGGDIYNFSVDMDGAPLGTQAFADIVLNNAPGLLDEVQAGMTDDPDGWMRTEIDGEVCWQIRFGTMHGDYFATERTFAVGADSHRLFEYDVAMDSWDEIPVM